jgi:hypothetical protein
MSDEASKAASTGATAGSAAAPEAPSMAFVEFLEGVPPGVFRKVKDLRAMRYNKETGGRDGVLVTPPLLLHCPSDECNGDRVFRATDSPEIGVGPGLANIFIDYMCGNCRQSTKTFALRTGFAGLGDAPGICFKFGETPSFGPPTPTRLLRLFGSDREMFLKGRRCENQGLGIGAFTYYRRIVENHKNQILDEIIKVAAKVAPGMVQMLEDAKTENQFLKSIDSVKHSIPQSLLINGHNPLMLLHSALSEGLHAQTDEQCLELAQAVRVVPAELAERIGQALKDEAELNAAITRLMNRSDRQNG